MNDPRAAARPCELQLAYASSPKLECGVMVCTVVAQTADGSAEYAGEVRVSSDGEWTLNNTSAEAEGEALSADQVLDSLKANAWLAELIREERWLQRGEQAAE